MAVETSPFPRDAAVAARLATRDGGAVRNAARRALAPGLHLPGAAVSALVADHGLADAEDLCLLLLPLAEEVAAPPISGFRVGAVGLTRSGGILLGGNLEWPGAHPGMTLHAEGFVAIRAWHRGETLSALAISEAHPCGHCRQCLAEYAAAGDMALIDPHGHRLSLDQLYPWPFAPADLGTPGAVAGPVPPLDIPDTLPGHVRALLVQEGNRAHAPYSGCRAALVLDHPEGPALGAVIESVAFNPTIQPVMSALVALRARGADPAGITGAWLMQTGGAVDYAAPTRDLLATLAPGATLTCLDWPA